MGTFEEFAGQYASRIRAAIHEDRFSTAARPAAQDLRASRPLAALKAVEREINLLIITDTGAPLTAEQRRLIYRGIAKELRLRDVTMGESMVRAASNDDLTDLVGYIDQIIGGRGR